MEELVRNLVKEISTTTNNPTDRPHVQPSVKAEHDDTGKGSVPTGNTFPFVASNIIQEAMIDRSPLYYPLVPVLLSPTPTLGPLPPLKIIFHDSLAIVKIFLSN